MKTLKTVIVTPVFVPEALPDLADMQENHIYISRMYKTAVHRCLCGCGLLTITPLYAGGWQLAESDAGKITLTPSIGNFSYPCNSHYIITDNKANFV